MEVITDTNKLESGKVTFWERHFLQKNFVHYTWIGAAFSVLNIILIWFFIDILHISTIIATSGVIFGQFILRYLIYRWIGIM